MREADCDGVGGVWRGRDGEAEEGADHERDLLFLRASFADYGLFDAAWSVFENGQPALGSSEKDGAAS